MSNLSEEEKKAIDILENVIADEVIGTYCTEFAIPKYNCNLCVDKNGNPDDCYYEKAIDIVLNLIEKQQKELDKKDKIIDKMAEKINQAYFDECNMWFWFEKEICSKNKDGKYDFKDLGTRKTRIKEYFKKEVEKDVKD